MSMIKKISMTRSKPLINLFCGSPKHAKKAAKWVESTENKMISRFKKVTGFHSGWIIIFLKIAGAVELDCGSFYSSTITFFLLLLDLEDLLFMLLILDGLKLAPGCISGYLCNRLRILD